MNHLLAHGALNSPWGVAMAPANFGAFSNDLLVGNLGDGTIHAYNLSTKALLGALDDQSGKTLVIDGLWDLVFGDGSFGKPLNTLFFSAGITGQANGLFGSLQVSAATPTPTSKPTPHPTTKPVANSDPQPGSTTTHTPVRTPLHNSNSSLATPVINSISKVIQVGTVFVSIGNSFTAARRSISSSRRAADRSTPAHSRLPRKPSANLPSRSRTPSASDRAS